VLRVLHTVLRGKATEAGHMNGFVKKFRKEGFTPSSCITLPADASFHLLQNMVYSSVTGGFEQITLESDGLSVPLDATGLLPEQDLDVEPIDEDDGAGGRIPLFVFDLATYPVGWLTAEYVSLELLVSDQFLWLHASSPLLSGPDSVSLYMPTRNGSYDFEQLELALKTVKSATATSKHAQKHNLRLYVEPNIKASRVLRLLQTIDRAGSEVSAQARLDENLGDKNWFQPLLYRAFAVHISEQELSFNDQTYVPFADGKLIQKRFADLYDAIKRNAEALADVESRFGIEYARRSFIVAKPETAYQLALEVVGSLRHTDLSYLTIIVGPNSTHVSIPAAIGYDIYRVEQEMRIEADVITLGPPFVFTKKGAGFITKPVREGPLLNLKTVLSKDNHGAWKQALLGHALAVTTKQAESQYRKLPMVVVLDPDSNLSILQTITAANALRVWPRQLGEKEGYYRAIDVRLKLPKIQYVSFNFAGNANADLSTVLSGLGNLGENKSTVDEHRAQVAFSNVQIVSGGGITVNELKQALEERMTAIRHCYFNELKRNPELKGKMDVGMTITKNGRVVDFQTKNTVFTNARACLKNTFTVDRFLKPKDAPRAEVSFTIEFSYSE